MDITAPKRHASHSRIVVLAALATDLYASLYLWLTMLGIGRWSSSTATTHDGAAWRAAAVHIRSCGCTSCLAAPPFSTAAERRPGVQRSDAACAWSLFAIDRHGTMSATGTNNTNCGWSAECAASEDERRVWPIGFAAQSLRAERAYGIISRHLTGKGQQSSGAPRLCVYGSLVDCTLQDINLAGGLRGA